MLVYGGFHSVQAASDFHFALTDKRFLFGLLLLTFFVLFTETLVDTDKLFVVLVFATQNSVFAVDLTDFVHNRIHIANVLPGLFHCIRREATLGKVTAEVFGEGDIGFFLAVDVGIKFPFYAVIAFLEVVVDDLEFL